MRDISDMMLNSDSQLRGLLKTASGSGRILILTHGNPDPDSIASASALKFLLTHLTRCQVRVAYPGIIGRVENRAMVKELALKMIPLKEINWRDYDTLALVDHQPRRRMYTWPSTRWPDIIIDHHPRRPLEKPAQFVDVRKQFGSNSSLMTSYLLTADLTVPRWLATALVYGMLTDTQDFSRGKTGYDKSAYLALFNSVDHSRLFRISHPAIDCQYLSQYWHALRGARLWGDAVETYIGEIPVPDATSEIADNLIIICGIRYALVTGFYQNTLYMSLRVRHARRDAGVIMRRIVGRRGSAGGHGFMAGAQIPDLKTPETAKSLALELHRSFIKLVIPNSEISRSHPILSELPAQVHTPPSE
ncbi:DHH family phosphoesterase [bacterium]|nr:DHH family phosphoesterase [candidate division CSSED10-310 bacterium]